MSKTHWLDVTEYIFLGFSIGGIVGTIITKQILLVASPLTLSILINIINRQRQLEQLKNLPEVSKFTEIYKDYLTITDEYRFYKLELKELSEQLQKKSISCEQLNFKSLISNLSNSLKAYEQRLYQLEQQSNNSHNFYQIEQKLSDKQHDFSNSITNLANSFNAYEKRLSQLEKQLLTNNSPIFNTSLKVSPGNCEFTGLLEKLISQIDIKNKHLSSASQDKILIPLEDIHKKIQKAIKQSHSMAATVTTYYRDHGATQEEAQAISQQFDFLAIKLSQINSLYEVKVIYQAVIQFNEEISRFKHKDKNGKYYWENIVRKEILEILIDCLIINRKTYQEKV